MPSAGKKLYKKATNITFADWDSVSVLWTRDKMTAILKNMKQLDNTTTLTTTNHFSYNPYLPTILNLEVSFPCLAQVLSYIIGIGVY